MTTIKDTIDFLRSENNENTLLMALALEREAEDKKIYYLEDFIVTLGVQGRQKTATIYQKILQRIQNDRP